MNRRRVSLLATTILVGIAATAASAMHFSPWGTATKIDEIPGWSSELNTPFLDGCPIQAPDGLSLYHGVEPSWWSGSSRHLGRATAEQACPVRRPGEPRRACQLGGGRLLSDAGPRRRALLREQRSVCREACGLGDIYFTRFNRHQGWSEPSRLACAPDGPNSALDEQGPSYFKAGRHAYLYFSSSSGTVPGRHLRQPATRRRVLRARLAGRIAERAPRMTSSRTCARAGARSSFPRTTPIRARSVDRTSTPRPGGTCRTRGRFR